MADDTLDEAKKSNKLLGQIADRQGLTNKQIKEQKEAEAASSAEIVKEVKKQTKEEKEAEKRRLALEAERLKLEEEAKSLQEALVSIAEDEEGWSELSNEAQEAQLAVLEAEYKESQVSQKDFAKFHRNFVDSGAQGVAEFQAWEKDAKEAAVDRKNKDNKDKRAAWDLRKQLKDAGVTNEAVLEKAEATRREGLTVNVATAKADEKEFELAEQWRKRDDQKKADDDKKEQKRQARNAEILSALRGQLEQMGVDAELADRLAKKAMQMKESVHKWWEDKKSKIAAGAKSILSWIMKGAGLFLLYKLFDFLSKTNLKELYEIAVKAFDFIWTGMKTIGAWVGGIKVFKWIDDFFGKSKGWKAFRDFWKGIGGKITKAFKDFKISGLITKVINLFKSGGAVFKWIFKAFGGGASLIVWDGIIAAIKGVFKMITGPFGKEGGIGKAFASVTKFFSAIPGMKTVTKFAAGALKWVGKLFAPVMLVWGIIEGIMGGWDAAEKEKGGMGQKILAFMSGALKALLDFFVFDLAQMVEDGIKWAIKWVMGLFGFSEEEQKKATDWSIVGAVRDAIFKAIDWVKNLFKFDGKGISFKGLAPLIDIILFPLNAAFKWITGLFGWDTDKDGKKKKDWSIGGLITSALDNIFKWLGSIFDIDFAGIVADMLGGLGKAGTWLAGKLGLGPDTKESLQEEIDDLLSQNEKDTSRGSGSRKNTRNLEIEKLKAKMEQLATGGTILPGGAAIVGEGSTAGELVENAASTAKVIPAKQTADMMSGMGSGGQMIAPTTILNSAPSSTTMIAASSSLNPISQKYFRN